MKRLSPSTEEVVHGERQLRAKLEKIVTRDLANTLAEASSGRDIARMLAGDPKWGALHRLAQKWVRKSAPFFGEEVIRIARERCEERS
jgi:hypothetical protein